YFTAFSSDSPEIDIHLTANGRQLSWKTADKGMGIPDKEKKQVFSRFYRVGNEDTRKTKGTGLGLYIVQQIIQAHSGKITVSDNEPSGTVFNISLPLDQAIAHK
ncbi:MAG: HAMP domain-containing sensor histidine kinase, partial [Bacteroidota bacterium]